MPRDYTAGARAAAALLESVETVKVLMRELCTDYDALKAKLDRALAERDAALIEASKLREQLQERELP
jgi:regulator of replication initiation timing